MQKSVVAGVFAAVASFATWVTHAQEKRPLLDAMQAMMEGNFALDATLGRADSAIDGPDFDQAGNEWRMVVARGESIALRRYLITVNETSGEVCVRGLPATDCVAKGDAGVALQAARDKRQGLAEVALYPPPDLQGVMKAVLRHELTSGGYLASNRMPVYVSIGSPKGDSAIDLSPESIRDLGEIGVQLMPGSAWQQPPDGTRVGKTMSMGLGIPTRRADGDYDLQFGFHCGSVCGSQYEAVLRHDASGWRVLSSEMGLIF